MQLKQEQEKQKSLERELKRLQEETVKSEDEFLSQKQVLEREISEISTENASLETEIESMKTQKETVEGLFQTSERELDSTTREVANLKVKVNELKSEVMKQEQENEEMRVEVESAAPMKEKPLGKNEKAEEDLAKEVDTVKWRLEQLQMEHKELTNRISEYETRARQQDDRLQTLHSTTCDKETASKDEAILRERLSTLKLEHQTLESEHPARNMRSETMQSGCCRCAVW